MQQSSYDYDDDKFDSGDKDTWLYYKDGHVHLEWAMDFDLIPWEDYCPLCGYTILDDEIIEPFILCIACGGTTVEEEDPYELDAIAYAEKKLIEEEEKDKPIPRERKKRYLMKHMLMITENT
ncbi:MAG: hypothetical protein M5U34_04655 [Chloroflexi bacterium]|nr:hypothetical protein [Chloroflexota bacterium]